MTDDEAFASAQERVKKLSRAPGTDDLLALYSLFKQATQGDAKGERPGMLDFKGRAKFDAWVARRGLPQADAKRAYVELVTRLETASN
jgi:diazepam-binding inhibitor (GABA receptor modulator, acyl-CoA-binding protein)